MHKLSGIILTGNEEKMIEDALKSLSFCDEIIVIDSGSTDRTKEIAEKYKAKIHEDKTNSFAERRNLGLQKAEGDFVLYLDTDERVDDDLRDEIKKILSKGTNFSAFKLQRKNFYLGKNEWPYIEKLERLFKKDKLKQWKGELHESPVIDGEVGELKGFILHFTHRDLDSMLEKTIKWSTTESLLRFNTNHPKMTWWRFPRVMLTAFFDSYIKQQGFKKGTVGVIEGTFQAYSMFITYAKLWELQKNESTRKHGD